MSHPQILINGMSYHLNSGIKLFNKYNLTIHPKKIGLVGRNGCGKTTLLKLILGETSPTVGSIQCKGDLAYVTQNALFEPTTTIAGVFGVEDKLRALIRLREGSIAADDYLILDDDWLVQESLRQQLSLFKLDSLSPMKPLCELSGGEITRLMLAQAFARQADFLLLDEPTNHLDHSARSDLYQAIEQWPKGMIIASHDRELLNLMNEIIELSTLGLATYGGNYNDYKQQKALEHQSHLQQLSDAKKVLKHTMAQQQSTREKHAHKRAQGRTLKRNGSIDKLTANSKKGRSEATQSHLLVKEERLQKSAMTALQSAKEKIEVLEDIHVELALTKVPLGKVMLDIKELTFAYVDKNRIITDFNLQLRGPERLGIIGNNGSGKSTLVKLILNQLSPDKGIINLGTPYVRYLDQNASLLNPHHSVLENFMLLNPDVTENMARASLAQFLFRNLSVNKLANHLSGGEKMRALLACVLMGQHPPQLLILDEPTNHLDLMSITSIESALNHFQGTMIVISHDYNFLKNLQIERIIHAPFIN